MQNPSDVTAGDIPASTDIGREKHSIFRVGPVELDESRLELRVDGEPRAVEAKPLALLHALLLHAGAVVSKRDLITAVWGNADHISETSLTTAMSKLRAALGEKGRSVIEVVHGSGYRIGKPVDVTAARDTPRLAFTFKEGEAVPGRPQWRLERLLGSAPLNDVWLARHPKTTEARVFKFADSVGRLDTLKREAALSRALFATLGARDDLVRIVEWNFDTRPFFIESAYGGPDLPTWAAAQGGLAARPLIDRLAMLAQIARTMAAAHAAGVLHSDIKPANILVAESDDPTALPRLRLVDFGAGGLSDTARLAALAISTQGFLDEDGERSAGTLRYMAPEVFAGAVPTTAADIYALGVLLYQMVVGDLSKPLAVGWEADIADPLLREDIALAASGDPARRLDSAASLAERLETLETRRAERERQAEERERAAALARHVERERTRRPWILAAALSMVAGLAIATWFGIQAMHDRDEARRRADIAVAVNRFLTDDLLGRGNPAQSGKADETLMEAAEAAEAGIDRRLGGEPLVAGSIYLSLARAFDSRSAYDAARHAYENAVAAFTKAGEPGRAEAVIASLQEASMEAIAGQAGAMERAKQLTGKAASIIATLGPRENETRVWLDYALGQQDLMAGNAAAARKHYEAAADRAQSMPDIFSPSVQLNIRKKVEFTYLRLGEWQHAESLISVLIGQRMALSGARHPATLDLALDLARVRIQQGKAAEALADIDRVTPDFVAVYGADHIQTLTLLGTRAEALSQLERYSDATADQMTVYRQAVAKFGDHSYMALAALIDASQSQCRGGELEAGRRTAEQAYQGTIQTFGAKNGLTQVATLDLVFCLITMKDSRRAEQLLGSIDLQAISDLTMDPTESAQIDVMRAAIALQTKDSATGKSLLAKAIPVLEQSKTNVYMQRWAQELMAGQ